MTERRISPQVSCLAHATPPVAEEIRSVMVAAYRVEAELLGVADFPPLDRTAAHIAATEARFFGVRRDGALLAVAEVEDIPPARCHIGSLVVRPTHFRQGLATALLRHVLEAHPSHVVTVSTGALNRPALLLYAAHDFVEQRRWSAPGGIPMVTLERQPSVRRA
jgi:ribosomal protein S18 acetylase RimI-like enzyme